MKRIPTKTKLPKTLEYLKKHSGALMVILALLGALLSWIGLQNSAIIGAAWYDPTRDNPGANDPWTLAPNIVIPAQQAYIYAGLGALWVGGVTAGISIIIFEEKKAIATFLASILFTALGFNTLEWMLAVIIASAAEWHLTWYFYFFNTVMPLWIGGSLIGAAATIFAKYL